MKPPDLEWSALQFNSYRFDRSRRSWIFHPVILFSVVWAGVVSLYSLHLSKLLFYNSTQALATVAYLWLPFVLVVLLYDSFLHFSRFAFGQNRIEITLNYRLLTKRLRRWFLFWVAISCIEIVASGGLPILWLLQGSSKTYFDFGIPTLHGFMNSLLLAIAVTSAALYGILRRKRHLLLPAFVILWSILAITRNMMIVILLEVSLLLLQLAKVRLQTVFRIFFGVIVLVFVFGVIGDLRTGADSFRLLAQPTKNYPDWLPSGVLWAYIYLVTPLNNLVYTAQGTQPLYNILFPNTLSLLLPTVLRTIVFGQDLSSLGNGDLVTSAFNVSTAYAGPYQDFGFVGMMLFSAFIGVISISFWEQTSLRGLLIYTILAQCLILTVFYNHFLLLPIITQVGWIAVFFMPEIRYGKRDGTSNDR
jgi:oligosaccharide repeat unit polymerase